MPRLPRDDNQNPIQLAEGMTITKTITFDGGTVNGIGDENGTNDPFTIFTVTGTILAKVFGVCTTDLVGVSATVEIGLTGNTAGLIAQSTATAIDASDIWHSATITDVGETVYTDVTQRIIGNGLDIIGTVGTANITAGVIDFFCIYVPLSEGALVEEA